MSICIIRASSIFLLLRNKSVYGPIVFWSIHINFHEDMQIEARMPETLVTRHEYLIQYCNSDQDFNV
jgi:hypothetical protein